MNIFIDVLEDGTIEFPLTVLDLRKKFPSRAIPLSLTNPELMSETLKNVYVKIDGATTYLTSLNTPIVLLEHTLKPTLRGGKWYFDPTPLITEQPEPPIPVVVECTLPELKQLKLRHLSLYTDNLVSDIAATQNIPSVEMQTWSIQMAEASAWELNPEVPTPMLDTIAIARGVDRGKLIGKALVKSKLYNQLLAHIVGSRQRIEDSINAAQDKDSLSFIQIVIDIPREIVTDIPREIVTDIPKKIVTDTPKKIISGAL